jgi:hypothetical protein
MKNNQIPKTIQQVLKELKVNNPELLGKGGEGYVFSYKNDLVIKIYDNADKKYLKSLQSFQSFLTTKYLPFTTPLIIKIDKSEETYYTIEKRLTGVLMEEKFPSVSEKDKYTMLNSYYEALKALNSIELLELPFGSIVDVSHEINDETWPGFLIKMLDYKLKKTGDRVAHDVINFEYKVKLLSGIIKKELNINKKYLVHADYFVNQVLVNENNEISAVLDISSHAVIGDPRLDIAGVFFFEGMKQYTKEHIQFLLDLSVRDYGKSILKYNDIYRMYYCFYFSEVHTFMPDWYQTLIKNLNNEEIWKRLNNY